MPKKRRADMPTRKGEVVLLLRWCLRRPDGQEEHWYRLKREAMEDPAFIVFGWDLFRVTPGHRVRRPDPKKRKGAK